MDPSFERLRSIVATRTRRIVIWCGAGLSAPAGIPTWALLQRLLERALVAKLETIDLPEESKEQKVRAIRQESNPWIAFHRLQNELGPTSYRETIRQAISRAVVAEVPPAYHAIWKLRPSGLINLNLDRLATRAFAEKESSRIPIEFKGKEIGRYFHTLDNPRPFICNLHGIEEDVDSWVFTQPALRELAATAAYQSYLSAVLTTCTVIFVGVTAEDTAVGGHLERLLADGINPRNHYWITDRRDSLTDQWAENNNIQVIRYKASDSSHPELVSLLEELASYVEPEDLEAPPVVLDLGLQDIALEPQFSLVTRSSEEIRSALNAHAAALLKSNDEKSVKQYEDFSLQYDRAIHMAWYTSTRSQDNENIFLGYRLIEEVARGAFGIVFKGVDREGREVAIKVLHSEIRKEAELLRAFRRGTRSMRIVSERKVQGMVEYIAASEIPATLIMEWVYGPNLADVVEMGLDEWALIIDIVQQLTRIIAEAHALPERVLHRDIRPSNMIVSGYWDGGDVELRVIDFDLSWHRGSVEKSVIFGSQLSGYLAPEQLQRTKGVSTQHASVDSYGIGMTLFYMVSGRNPSPGEHAHAIWRKTLQDAVSRPRGSSWKSLPARIARLIWYATRHQQVERWDVIQIRSEIARLAVAVKDQGAVDSAELWAEELCARSGALKDYVWNDDRLVAERDFGTGLKIYLSADEGSREIIVNMTRVAGEADNRNRLGDAINRARDQVRSVLVSGGWFARADAGLGMLTVEATLEISHLKENPARALESLERAVGRMTFN